MIYCSGILLLSILKLNSTGSLNEARVVGFRADYLLHVLIFVPFMLLFRWGWGFAHKSKTWFWPAVVFGLLLASVSEIVQWPLTYRTFNPIDLLANWGGIMLGAVIARWDKGKR